MIGHNRVVDLMRTWRNAKQAEVQAAKVRLDTEHELIDLIKARDEGTTHIMEDSVGVFRVRTGLKRNWKQNHLRMVVDEVPEKLFPFIANFQEDKRLSKWVEHNEPQVWKVLSPGLTLKPAKPYFFHQEFNDDEV